MPDERKGARSEKQDVPPRAAKWFIMVQKKQCLLWFLARNQDYSTSGG